MCVHLPAVKEVSWEGCAGGQEVDAAVHTFSSCDEQEK